MPDPAAVAAAGSVEAAVANAPPTVFDIQEATTKTDLRAGLGNTDAGSAVEAWATILTDEITRGVTLGTTSRSRSASARDPRMDGLTARKPFWDSPV